MIVAAHLRFNGRENHRRKEKREWEKPFRNALDKSDRNRFEGYKGAYVFMQGDKVKSKQKLIGKKCPNSLNYDDFSQMRRMSMRSAGMY